MDGSAVCPVRLTGNQSTFFQTPQGEGNMPLGHAPSPDDIRRPVSLRVVGQKQQHIQLVVGQVPFFADRLHQAAVAFLRPKRRFKKSKLHMHAPHLVHF